MTHNLSSRIDIIYSYPILSFLIVYSFWLCIYYVVCLLYYFIDIPKDVEALAMTFYLIYYVNIIYFVENHKPVLMLIVVQVVFA